MCVCGGHTQDSALAPFLLPICPAHSRHRHAGAKGCPAASSSCLPACLPTWYEPYAMTSDRKWYTTGVGMM